MASTLTTNLGLQKQGTGDNPGTWGANLNTNVIDLLDSALGAPYAANVAGSSDVTLSTTNAGNLVHNLTGIITANINYIFPATAGRFLIVKNATTGSFTVTVKPSGGTGVVIPQGTTQFIYIDSSVTTAYAPVSLSGLGGLAAANNLSDLASASSARTNLGVPVGTSGHALPFMDGTNVWSGSNDFTGSTTIVATQSSSDSSTKAASTAFVNTATAGKLLNVQTFTSTGTYTPTTGTNTVVIYGIGGGGGGAGGGGNGTNGGTTSVGSLLSLGGGVAANGLANGAGGSPSTGTITFVGSPGFGGGGNGSTTNAPGGNGGVGIFGAGGGAGGAPAATGGTAGANSGGGGGGGGSTGGVALGAGGGSGAFGITYASSITGTYAVTIGTAGAAGAAGSGTAGGAGAKGIVIIFEYH